MMLKAMRGGPFGPPLEHHSELLEREDVQDAQRVQAIPLEGATMLQKQEKEQQEGQGQRL